MKVVLAGGSGHVGAVLERHFLAQVNDVRILSRSGSGTNHVAWDGKTLGPWAESLDGADVVINLAGRSVNCRYTVDHLNEMMDSRVDSTRVIGEAIALASNPPKVWLQSSTATIYGHRFDAANDEQTEIVNTGPRLWQASVEIAKTWERTLDEANTPRTRKVAMRSAMTMSPDRGSIFDVLCGLTRRGLGGTIAGGRQYISWIHERDFAQAVQFLIERDDLSSPVNLCSPFPLPQREFMAILRRALGVRFGLPATEWMVEIGTRLMRTESELILKSRRVVPKRLLDAGFVFEFPEWEAAARDLVRRLGER